MKKKDNFLSDPNRPSLLGGRPAWEGVVTWPIDYSRYTEWMLLHRGYVPRRSGDWLTGFYHFNRVGVSAGGGDPYTNLDEDGYNEIALTPVGEKANKWADSNWKRNFPGLYAWYMDEQESRPYYHGSILFIKSDTYVHNEKTTDSIY